MLRDSEPVVIFDPQLRAEVVFLLVSMAAQAGNSYSYGGNNFVFRFSVVMAPCVEMIAIAGFGGWQISGGCRQGGGLPWTFVLYFRFICTVYQSKAIVISICHFA
jgi:hypothetical protein